MDTEDVWQLIERARADVADPADAEAVVARMNELLGQRSPDEIVAFDRSLWDLVRVSYRADLWAAAYLINGGASDDGFDYFRGWLIAQGKAAFTQALADPDSLADLPAVVQAAEEHEDLWCEDLLSVAWSAYRAVTGTEPPMPTSTAPLPALDPAWDFDFDDGDEMRRRLPRLAGLFRVR